MVLSWQLNLPVLNLMDDYVLRKLHVLMFLKSIWTWFVFCYLIIAVKGVLAPLCLAHSAPVELYTRVCWVAKTVEVIVCGGELLARRAGFAGAACPKKKHCTFKLCTFNV